MQTAAHKKGTTQHFIEVWDIVDDVVLLQNGSAAIVLETTAVNFQLLSSEEQGATIAAFSALLNSLSFPIQIVVHSKKLDLSSYIKMLARKIQAEGNTQLKDEAEKYASFVEGLMKNNAILDKRFYIAIPFSPLEAGLTLKKIEKKILLEKAKAMLYPKRDQILSLLSQMGIRGQALARKELISLFYTIYNAGQFAHPEALQNGIDTSFFTKRLEEFNRGLIEIPDLVAPPLVEVDFTTIKIGKTFYRTLFVSGYPSFASPNWLSPLVSFEHTLDVAFFIYPVEAGDVLSDLKRKIAEMEATISSQMQEGKDIDPKARASLDDALRLQDELVRGGERFFQFGLYITIPADSKVELEAVTKQVRATLASLLIKTSPATLQMEDGFKTTMPLGIDKLYITRNMDTTSLATTFPFTSSELTSENGILYGINQHNGSLIIFDRFSLENANSLVLGKSGGGKSFLIKLEAIRSLMFGTELLIIDPENEYRSISEAVGGEYLSFKGREGKFINPFDLAIVVEEGENALSSKILSLLGLLKTIMGELAPQQEAVLDQALIAAYKNRGITQDPQTHKNTPPIMEDLYSVLLAIQTPDSQGLASRLERFVKGSLAGLFNKPTSIDITNPFTVFSLRDIEEVLRPMAMYIILDFIWTRVRKERKKRILIVDEAWHLMRHKDSANFLFSIAKRARKYSLGLTTITQDVEDFLATEYGRAIVTNSSIQILLKQSPASIELVGKTFNLSQGERYLLLNAGVGQGLFFAGSNHVAIGVVAADYEKELILQSPQVQPQTQT